MALRTITRVSVGPGSTVVSFVEGALDNATFVVEGSLVDQSDNSLLPFNPETDVTLKTITGFTVTSAVAAWFTGIAASYGSADVDSDLQSNAIVTLAEVKQFLGIETSDTTYDAFLRTLINQTSDVLEGFTNSKIALQDVSEIVSGNGDYRMTMNSKPVYRVGIDSPMGNPLASDGFASSFGTTDGLGHTQSEFVGTGGDSLAWTNRVSTFTVSSGAAVPSASTATLATVDVSESDVIAQVECTWATSGNVGLCLRYVDTSNYLLAYHNGTSVKFDKVVAGVTYNLLSSVTTYVAGAILKVVCDGTEFRVYYNGTQVGSELYCHNNSTSELFGLYATTATVSLDDFGVFSLLDAVQVRSSPHQAFDSLLSQYKQNMMVNSWPRKSTYIELFSNAFTDGYNNILLHYKAGYSPIPEIFTEIALERIAAEFYKSGKSGHSLILKGSSSFNQTGGSISGGGGSGLDQISGLSQTHRNMLQAAGYVFYESPIAEMSR